MAETYFSGRLTGIDVDFLPRRAFWGSTSTQKWDLTLYVKPSKDARDRCIDQLEAKLEWALARIAQLEAENAELRARLGLNSTNSSKPPSSDPPEVERGSRKPTGRKRGGQPGHKPHKRKLVPPDKVTRTTDVLPDNCKSGGYAVGIRSLGATR